MNIAGHTFLVTGGGSGLGAACVRRLIQSGGRILIADLAASAGQLLANEVGSAVCFIPTDVTHEQDMQAAIGAAIELSSGDGLRGLINCAGIAPGEKLLGKSGPHSLDLFTRIIEVN